MIRLALFFAGVPIGAAALLAGCAEPQIVQATDCRGAAQPCGIVYATGAAHAMTNVPLTIPVSAIP